MVSNLEKTAERLAQKAVAARTKTAAGFSAQLGNIMRDPKMIGGLIGAGVGGMSALSDPEERSSTLHRALLGAGAGAAVGTGYQLLNSGAQQLGKSMQSPPGPVSALKNNIENLAGTANKQVNVADIAKIHPESVATGLVAGAGREAVHGLRDLRGAASNSQIADYLQGNAGSPAAKSVLQHVGTGGTASDIAKLRTMAHGSGWRGTINKLLNRTTSTPTGNAHIDPQQAKELLKTLGRGARPRVSGWGRLRRGGLTSAAAGLLAELGLDQLDNASRDAVVRAVLGPQ